MTLLDTDAHGALDEVAFGFAVIGLPEETFAVLRMHLVEPLGDLYDGTFELVTDDFDLPPQDLLEKPAAATLRRGGRERIFHGVLRRVEDVGVQDVGSGPLAVAKRVLRVWLAPRLWLLSQRVDCRIFQQLTAKEVFLDVLRRAGVYGAAKVDVTQMTDDREPIEYVVQYNESDLDFLRRLMQREGFWMRFVQGDDSEAVALHDGGRETDLPDVAADLGMVVAVRGREVATARDESVRSVEWHRSVVPTRVSVGDHDLTRPRFVVRGQRPTRGDGRREVYRHPGPARFSGYNGSSYEGDDAAHLAGLHYASASADALVGEGTGNVLGFGAGNDFRFAHTLTRRYVLVHVEHEGEAPELLLTVDDRRGARERYGNTFRCLDATKPLALAEVTPKPLIHGPQTATVVGPPGEDVYTDEHGRIKVQFHWDRHGVSDERSTCWLRVTQSWGGGAFGVQFIPRVGMEVVVCFLDGDPDRPLVIGCVYPQTYDWPFLPPGHKNRAGVRTNTVGRSPMDRRYNELSFDDTPGHEEVLVHASRNLREEVANDHATYVGRNQSVHVKGVQSVVVDGEGGEAGKHATVQVTGDLSIKVTENVTIEAGSSINLKCGDAAVKVTPNAIVATYNSNWLFIGKDTRWVKGPDGVTEVESEVEVVQLHCQGADLAMEEDRVTVNTSGTSMVMEPNKWAAHGAMGADLSSTGATTVSGVPVQLQGPGLPAARMTDPAPAAVMMGAALVHIGGPSFPLPVVVKGKDLHVGNHLVIQGSKEDPQFQAKVLRDLGIMASTPAGLQRIENLDKNPGGHTTTVREYTQKDADVEIAPGVKAGWNNSFAQRKGQGGLMTKDAAGNPVPGAGSDTEVAYNPEIVIGPEGSPEPADATLFHELGHAEHNAYGANQSAEDTGDDWHDTEEWQNIEGPINQAGDEHTNDIPGVPYSPSENEYLEDRSYPYRRIDHGGGYEDA